MKQKRYFLFLIIFFILFNICGCNKKDSSKDSKELNVYIDIKDKHTLNVLKTITDGYKNTHDVKLNITNSLVDDIEKDISKENSPDLVFISRNEMMNLGKKGLLDEMKCCYDKDKINNRYYSVFNSYGRYGDKYYGIGVVPYTIEILYNKEALKKLDVKEPKNIKDMKTIMKKVNKDKKIPVLLPDDIDINTIIFSIIANNKINSIDLEKAYDKGKEEYLKLDGVKESFDTYNNLVKEGIITKDTFENANEISLDKFKQGDIPFIIAMSYYNQEFKGKNIEVLKSPYNVDKLNDNTPVLVNCLASVPLKGKNSEEVSKFLDFMLSNKNQEAIIKKGVVTANKEVNKKQGKSLSPINKNTVKSLKDANEDSIMFLYNINSKIKPELSSKLDDILAGKYTGKEWEEIVKYIK